AERIHHRHGRCPVFREAVQPERFGANAAAVNVQRDGSELAEKRERRGGIRFELEVIRTCWCGGGERQREQRDQCDEREAAQSSSMKKGGREGRPELAMQLDQNVESRNGRSFFERDG